MEKHPSDPPRRGDRLRQLRSFCHSARLGSITRAAEFLRSSQPSVSQQVRLLEHELGVSLFERNGPRVFLTPAGQRLYRNALPVVAEMDRLPEAFAELHRGAGKGELRIATGPTIAEFMLPRYLKRFQDEYPAVRIRVRTGSGDEQLGELRAYETDVAIGAMGGALDDLDARILFVSHLILVTPLDHPLAGRESVTLREITAYPCIAPPPGYHSTTDTETYLRRRGLALDTGIAIGGWNAIRACAEAGLGIALIPDFCLTGSEEVWRIPMTGILPPRRYRLITRRGPVGSLAAQGFVRILDPGFAAEDPATKSNGNDP